MFLKGN